MANELSFDDLNRQANEAMANFEAAQRTFRNAQAQQRAALATVRGDGVAVLQDLLQEKLDTSPIVTSSPVKDLQVKLGYPFVYDPSGKYPVRLALLFGNKFGFTDEEQWLADHQTADKCFKDAQVPAILVKRDYRGVVAILEETHFYFSSTLEGVRITGTVGGGYDRTRRHTYAPTPISTELSEDQNGLVAYTTILEDPSRVSVVVDELINTPVYREHREYKKGQEYWNAPSNSGKLSRLANLLDRSCSINR